MTSRRVEQASRTLLMRKCGSSRGLYSSALALINCTSAKKACVDDEEQRITHTTVRQARHEALRRGCSWAYR